MSTDKKRVLYITQEIEPYMEMTEIAGVGRYLPQGIQERGKEIRTFMPRFGCVNERRNQLHEVIRLSGMNLIIDDTDHLLVIKVASIQSVRMQVYFIDNEDFFYRKTPFVDADGNDYKDNDERSVFFARGVLETVKKLRWTPDIIHCHGWMSALVPMYVKKSYCDDPFFANSKIVYSVYGDEFKQTYEDKFFDKLMIKGVDKDEVKRIGTPNFVGVSKLALNYADAVVQGSVEVNQHVMDYAKERNLPIMDYVGQEEGYVEAYDNFYDTLLSE